MNKKLIGIVIAIIILILAVSAIFTFTGKNNNVSDNVPEFDYGQMAENMGKTEEELMEELQEPLDDEQKKALDEVFDKYTTPDITEFLGTNEDGSEIYYKDTEGNEGVIELDDRILNMTDEEVDEYMQQQLEILDKIAAGEEVDPGWLDEPVIGNPDDPGDEGGQTADTVSPDPGGGYGGEEGYDSSVGGTNIEEEEFSWEDNPYYVSPEEAGIVPEGWSSWTQEQKDAYDRELMDRLTQELKDKGVAVGGG